MNDDKEYIAFHRERQKPVDAYTHAEIDVMLEQVKAEFEERYSSIKKEMHDNQISRLKDLVAKWRIELEEINNKLKNCYTRDEVDTKIRGINISLDNLRTNFRNLGEYASNMGDVVDKYMKKKRWFKK